MTKAPLPAIKHQLYRECCSKWYIQHSNSKCLYIFFSLLHKRENGDMVVRIFVIVNDAITMNMSNVLP